jgi:glucan phosphoethanolaminetransferase (alkaline phosphatase superfamily)
MIPIPIIVILLSLAVAYVGYLQLQLYISRRIIQALQTTNLEPADKVQRTSSRWLLFAVGFLLLAGGWIYISISYG